MSYLVSFCSCVLSIPITSLEEERANLSAVRTFVRFVLVWICRVSLSLSVWEGLRFVIVVLPGLFPYLFLCRRKCLGNNQEPIIYFHISDPSREKGPSWNFLAKMSY